MAGFYPLTYSDSATYGVNSATSPDRNINPYFYIHNSNNNSIFSSATESPVKFDVYTFRAVPTEGDESPKVSYAVIIIKNMGSANSLVTLTSATINMNPGDSVTNDNNPFSLVNRFTDFEQFGEGANDTYTGGVGILTPTQFNDLDGPSGETNYGMRNNKPLAYIKIDANSGEVNDGSFDEAPGVNSKYIPVFRTDTTPESQVPEDWNPQSLCIQFNNLDGISAKQIGDTTYPEYAAIVVKCKPQIDMDTVGGKLELYFSNPNTFITLDLHVTAYRKGDISYEQGWWNTNVHNNNAPSFVRLTGQLGSGISAEKKEKSYIADYQVSVGTLSQANYPQTIIQANNSDDGGNIVTPFQASNDFGLFDMDKLICPGFYPVGYSIEESNAHVVGTADPNIDYSRFIVRAYDSTINQGGVRFLHGFRTNLAQQQYVINQSESDYFTFNQLQSGSQSTVNDRYNETGDAPLQYLKTLGSTLDQTPADLNVQTPEQQQFLGGFFTSAEVPIGSALNATNYEMEDEDVYIKISFKDFSHNMHYYRRQENAGADRLHPHLGTQFTAHNTFRNRRVNITAVPFFHNPFWISEEAAQDGVNEEKVHRDTLYVATGNYFLWSTNVETLSNFGRLESVAHLHGVSDYVFRDERFSDFKLSEDVAGANEIPAVYSANLYKEELLPDIVQGTHNISSTPSDLDGSATPIYVWKHKHIFDFFNIPNVSADVVSPYLQLQFNNLSGLDDFYCDQFNFVDGPPQVNYLNQDLSFESMQIIKIGNDKFIPKDITDAAKQNPYIENSVIGVFRKNENTIGGAWQELSGTHYLAGSKKKTIHIRLKYKNPAPGPSYNITFNAWDGMSNPSADSGNLDPLGRYLEDTSIEASDRAFNAMTGHGSATQQYCGSRFAESNTFKLYLHGRSFYPMWRGFKITQFEDFTSGQGLSSIIAAVLLNSPNTVLRPWVQQTLYVTSYVQQDTFGTHGVTSSSISNGVEEGKLRTALSADIIKNACQNTSATSINFDTHGLKINGANANGIKGIRHDYAVTDSSKKFYYRKYPLNGKCCYKYERYFKDRALHTQTTVETANNNYEPYGILPGPLAEGRFKEDGTPYNLKAPTGTFVLSDSQTILSGTLTARNTTNNSYEIKIPFNLHNNNYQAAQIVSIDLENKVGTAGSHLYGVSKSFGDPRYINGDSTKGEYKTALHTVQNDDTWSAPYLGGVSANAATPTMDLIGDITSGYIFTFADNANNPGFSSVVHKMKVVSAVDASGGAITIPDGTHAWIHNSTTLHFKNGVAADAANVTITNGVGATVTFDYPKPDYAIWDIIAHSNTSTTQESLYKANLVNETNSTGTVGNIVKLMSFNQDIGNTAPGADEPNAYFANSNLTEAQADAFNGLPEEKFVNNEMVTLHSNGTKLGIRNDAGDIYEAVGHFPVGIFEDFNDETLGDQQTLYGKYCIPNSSTSGGNGVFNYMYFYDTVNAQPSTQALGVPVIYFALDGTAFGTGPDNEEGATGSDTNNSIGSATFINRLRVRYILHEKLDAYGVNQKRLTGTTQNGINMTNSGLDEIHVYEDTYLISVNFNNKIPEVIISDVEGDEKSDSESLDFGTMQIG